MDAVPVDGAALVLKPPSKRLWAAELPRALWMGATWWRGRALLAAVPRGDGRTVLLLPGLGNAHGSMSVMRGYLRRLGYRAEPWGLGRNWGARTAGREAETLIARLELLAVENGPVTLVGVSLGGLLARLAAHRRPDLVRQVVTVASPFAGHGRATNVWRFFEWSTGERLDDPDVIARSALIARALPVPSVAIWSRSDGLVNGLICRDGQGESAEVSSSHLWVQHRPEVLAAVARGLAAG